MSYEKNNEIYEIGQNIRARRKALGLSQDDLADRLGTDRNAISRHENGSREMGIIAFCDYTEALMANPSDLLPERVRPKLEGTYAELMETAAGLSEGDLAILLSMAKRLKNGFDA